MMKLITPLLQLLFKWFAYLTDNPSLMKNIFKYIAIVIVIVSAVYFLHLKPISELKADLKTTSEDLDKANLDIVKRIKEGAIKDITDDIVVNRIEGRHEEELLDMENSVNIVEVNETTIKIKY